ncbi:DNA cytosine methyltransferase [Lentimicrobium sp. L6]|uniref:DNA cytosine methyltransferase n=1 Tax=Lentimicrobium sp. L6 TaxID=2735916 RepID=UPI001553DAF4|nr:DNA cytosine methyltransferase [Lentimicrobium sp. L6]NPD85369.1 DNA cytosine methyltransferase [Lentimicrobium sp. L6]
MTKKVTDQPDKYAFPVIDLFAGPGGLGEGFSSIYNKKNERVFSIKLSIEKDYHAHKTLRLRSFYRQFKPQDVPELYYDYIKENDSKKKEELFESLIEKNQKEWQNAENEAWKFELPHEEGYNDQQIKKAHEEIDRRISACLSPKKDWVLIGGPPCQAFSLVGRSRNQLKDNVNKKDHRVFLYKEYLRIIAKHHPAIFVMENVKGLLSAKVDGEKVFTWMKNDLKNPGSVFENLDSPTYKVFSFVKEPDSFDENGFPEYKDDRAFLIKTEKFGVPQKRHRVIFLGIRQDIDASNIKTLEKSELVLLKNVIGSLPKIRSGIGREIIGSKENGKHIYKKIINNQENWEDSVSFYRAKLAEEFKDIKLNKKEQSPSSEGLNFLEFKDAEKENPLKDWYKDPRLTGILNHESRTHLKEDLARYLFSSIYLQKNGDFPKLRDYPEWLLPEHKSAKGGKFADRFRTQRPEFPATTITSHISKDGHYFIHYDPLQCRSLTVREAARIQSFPDNYYFCGARTHQYHQVGNAVPPFLAKQIGDIVISILKKIK